MALSIRVTVFIEPNRAVSGVFFGKDFSGQMASHARKLMSEAGATTTEYEQDDDVVLEAFDRDYQYLGSFSEMVFVPIDSTYILTGEEGRAKFEQRVGRPPTEPEFERVRNHFANGLHETGSWDILDEAIDIAATE